MPLLQVVFGIIIIIINFIAFFMCEQIFQALVAVEDPKLNGMSIAKRYAKIKKQVVTRNSNALVK